MPEYVPDNYDRFKKHDAELERRLQELPVCDCCGEHIQEESFHRIFGEVICDRCLDGMIEYVED